MTRVLRIMCRSLVALAVLNEIRGLVLAAPVMWGLYQSGGTWMAAWLAFCSLAGIACSVVVPLYVARKVEAKLSASK